MELTMIDGISLTSLYLVITISFFGGILGFIILAIFSRWLEPRINRLLPMDETVIQVGKFDIPIDETAIYIGRCVIQLSLEIAFAIAFSYALCFSFVSLLFFFVRYIPISVFLQ